MRRSKSSSKPDKNIRYANPNSARNVRIGEGSIRLNPLPPMMIPARISYTTIGIPSLPRRLERTGMIAASPVMINKAISTLVCIVISIDPIRNVESFVGAQANR